MGEVIELNKNIALQSQQIRAVMQHPADHKIVYDIDQLKPNHHLFEVDPLEGIAQPAEVIKTDIILMLNGVKRARQEIKPKPNCVYFPALNAENAIKKFKRIFGKK